MLVEAVVDKGQLRLLKSVRFVHEQVHVVVDIPDSEIVESEIHHHGASVLSSSSLIEQLWANRKRAADEASDLLDGVEKKYE